MKLAIKAEKKLAELISKIIAMNKGDAFRLQIANKDLAIICVNELKAKEVKKVKSEVKKDVS